MTEEKEVNVSEEEVEETIVSKEQAEEAKTEPQTTEETKPESSPGKTEEPEEVVETTEPEEPVVEPKQPKPVEGETPRELGLRKDNERLRSKLREKEMKKVFKQTEESVETPDYQKLKDAGYTDEDIERSKELISTLAPELGLVNAKQSYQEKANEELNNFIDDHKEYSATFDKDDVRWGRFQSILTSDYNLNGKTPKQLRTIFAKVNRDVIEELGEIPNSENKRNAQQQKIKSVSHSAGTKTKSVKTTKSPGETVAGGIKFSGFDDDELA